MPELSLIKFGILSDDDITNMSVCKIDKPSLKTETGTVYDPRLGCSTFNSVCVTCHVNIWSCPGHFGHIELPCPMILFFKETTMFLKCFCQRCGRLLAALGHTTVDNAVAVLSKHTKCVFCNYNQPLTRLKTNTVPMETHIETIDRKSGVSKRLSATEIRDIFRRVTIPDLECLDINPEKFHPQNLVLTKFPVIPTCCRPKVIAADNVCDDDLSIFLSQIIKLCQKLAQPLQAANLKQQPQKKLLYYNNSKDCDPLTAATKPDIAKERCDFTVCLDPSSQATAPDETKTQPSPIINLEQQLQMKLLCYCNNSKGRDLHTTNHKTMTGIKERIVKKSGIIRQNIMGKRCDFTARSVVGPDPTLELDQVAVPIEIADHLTMPEQVTPFNLCRLEQLVNTKRVPIVTRKNGIKICVQNYMNMGSIVLHHGDIIHRNGRSQPVIDCSTPLKEWDVVEHDGVMIPYQKPNHAHFSLEVGDVVNRYLQDGDPIILNRQPTLHKNSMMGMRVVRRPGKTIRVNLAITAGFNMDFDGDEGNLYLPQNQEAQVEVNMLMNATKNILSVQSNKSEIVIVQDSLLGAFLMTRRPIRMSRAAFYNCMMVITHDYDPTQRLNQITDRRHETGFTSTQLWGFLFPPNFLYQVGDLVIKDGILLAGALTKQHLKGSSTSLIRFLCLEYDNQTAANFVTNVQRLTNEWLNNHPFTISITDCFVSDCARRDIETTVCKYFMEADQAGRTSNITTICEVNVNCALNKAKDIGNKIVKDGFGPHNNFVATITSGSKGDYFNIAQISGLLGQQNIEGQRPIPEIDNNCRTLPHYPRVILDSYRKYESRGFVKSSFISGLNPKEMFFHAKSGREGMINTSHRTGATGYAERKMVKLNEDLVINYDGTVRDVKKNIIQYVYGYHGYDPTRVTLQDGQVYPINIPHLAARLNQYAKQPLLPLSATTINILVDACKPPSLGIPALVSQSVWDRVGGTLRTQLDAVYLATDQIPEFFSTVVLAYQSKLIAAGECVGILSAQSIGEQQTQQMLNTFHTAGKLLQLGAGRLSEILNVTKRLKTRTCVLWFKKRYTTANELRMAIGASLAFKTLGCLTSTQHADETGLRLQLDHRQLFMFRITPNLVVARTRLVFPLARLVGDGTTLLLPSGHLNWDKVKICGIKDIISFRLDYDHEHGEWLVITEGSNLAQLLGHPLIDESRLYCNDFWDIYNTLGISAVRKLMLEDTQQLVGTTNFCHVWLLIDKMTYRGKPMAIDRYTMRKAPSGPLSRAAFEESMDILQGAAIRTQVENHRGVSASIISGNRVKVGTGFFDLVYNQNYLIK